MDSEARKKRNCNVREALIAKGLAPERADLLLLGKAPEPVPVREVEVLKEDDNFKPMHEERK